MMLGFGHAVNAAFTPGHMSPGNMYPRRATYLYPDTYMTDTCRQIQVARPGYLWTVSRRHNYYSFMSRSTCITLYPATDGR